MVMALASASVTLLIYARKKLLRVRDGLIMTACSTALGLASPQMVGYVNDRVLQRGFGAFLIVLAVLVWFGDLGEGDRDSPLSAPVQIGIGSLAGALSGLFVVYSSDACGGKTRSRSPWVPSRSRRSGRG